MHLKTNSNRAKCTTDETHTTIEFAFAHSRQIVRLISDKRKWKWKKKTRCKPGAKKHLLKVFQLHFNLEINLAAVRLLSDIITFSLAFVAARGHNEKSCHQLSKRKWKKFRFSFLFAKSEMAFDRGAKVVVFCCYCCCCYYSVADSSCWTVEIKRKNLREREKENVKNRKTKGVLKSNLAKEQEWWANGMRLSPNERSRQTPTNCAAFIVKVASKLLE